MDRGVIDDLFQISADCACQMLGPEIGGREINCSQSFLVS
jgi:hypothetical protein